MITTKYKIGQPVWFIMEDGRVTITTVKTIVLEPIGKMYYTVDGCDYGLQENQLSVSASLDFKPEPVRYITPPGC